MGRKSRRKTKTNENSPHPIIACPETSPYHNGKFGHIGAGDSCDQFRPVLGDPAVFGFGANHEAADVLEEQERDIALRAQLNEVGAFEGGGGEEDAVVGEDTDGVAVNFRESLRKEVW